MQCESEEPAFHCPVLGIFESTEQVPHTPLTSHSYTAAWVERGLSWSRASHCLSIESLFFLVNQLVLAGLRRCSHDAGNDSENGPDRVL